VIKLQICICLVHTFHPYLIKCQGRKICFVT